MLHQSIFLLASEPRPLYLPTTCTLQVPARPTPSVRTNLFVSSTALSPRVMNSWSLYPLASSSPSTLHIRRSSRSLHPLVNFACFMCWRAPIPLEQSAPQFVLSKPASSAPPQVDEHLPIRDGELCGLFPPCQWAPPLCKLVSYDSAAPPCAKLFFLSTCGGKIAPEYRIKKKTSHRSKTPEPLPHPYTAALKAMWEWPWPGLSLRLVLWRGTDEGIFLTTTWNLLPRGVKPRIWGVLLRPPNQLS